MKDNMTKLRESAGQQKKRFLSFPLKLNSLICYQFPINPQKNVLTFLCFVSTFSGFSFRQLNFKFKQLKILCPTVRFRFVLCACLSVSGVKVKILYVHCTTSGNVRICVTHYAKWLTSLTTFLSNHFINYNTLKVLFNLVFN